MNKTEKQAIHKRRDLFIQRRLYLQHINSYLSKLTFLSGKNIKENTLLPLETVNQYRKKEKSYKLNPIKKYKVDCNEFTEYLHSLSVNLHKLCNKEVYVFLNETEYCGLYEFSSINCINFNFDFEFERSGVIVFVTIDTKNRLLLDFELLDKGKKMVVIEVQGEDWSHVEF